MKSAKIILLLCVGLLFTLSLFIRKICNFPFHLTVKFIRRKGNNKIIT